MDGRRHYKSATNCGENDLVCVFVALLSSYQIGTHKTQGSKHFVQGYRNITRFLLIGFYFAILILPEQHERLSVFCIVHACCSQNNNKAVSTRDMYLNGRLFWWTGNRYFYFNDLWWVCLKSYLIISITCATTAASAELEASKKEEEKKRNYEQNHVDFSGFSFLLFFTHGSSIKDKVPFSTRYMLDCLEN